MSIKTEIISVALDAASIGACTTDCILLGQHAEFCPVRTLFNPAKEALAQIDTEQKEFLKLQAEHTHLLKRHKILKRLVSRLISDKLEGKTMSKVRDSPGTKPVTNNDLLLFVD